MKKTILIISIIVATLLSYFVWSKIKAINSNANQLLQVIPSSTQRILAFDDFQESYYKLTEGLSIWNEVSNSDNVFNSFFRLKDQFSILPIDTLNKVLICELKIGTAQEWIIITNSFKDKIDYSPEIKKFKEQEYQQITLDGKKSYRFQFNNIVYLSSSLVAVQEIISNVLTLDFLSVNFDTNALSGSDFTIYIKNDKKTEIIDGFITSNEIELLSLDSLLNTTTLRLWDKLPQHIYNYIFEENDLDSTTVFSREKGRVTSGTSRAIMFGLNKSLKYSIESDWIVYDSLVKNKFVIQKVILQKLLGENENLEEYNDTIYGVEDVDFVLFSDSKQFLNELYYDIKSQENIIGSLQKEQLNYISIAPIQDSSKVKIETKKYLSEAGQSIIKTRFYEIGNVKSQTINDFTWKTNINGEVKQVFIVKNHRVNALEILVLDKANTIHLIDQSGNIKWNKSIKENVLGEIKQIDLLNNGKYQFVFNTKNTLHVVDILGKDVSGFPVQLFQNATSGVSVIDYVDNHDYRFFISTNSGIMCYDELGKRVQGFKFVKQNFEPISDVNHLLITGKDYLIVSEKNGKTYFLNRKGEERHQSDVSLNKGEVRLIQKSMSIESSSVFGLNSQNQLSEKSFSNKSLITVKDSTVLDELGQLTSNVGKSYIYGISEREVVIYSKTGNILKSINCDFKPKMVYGNFTTLVDGFIYIKSLSNQIYVYNLVTETFEKSIFDVSAFSVDPKLNINGLNSYVIGSGKELIVYPVK